MTATYLIRYAIDPIGPYSIESVNRSSRTQTIFFFDKKSERHSKQEQQQEHKRDKNKNETKTQTRTQQDANKKNK